MFLFPGKDSKKLRQASMQTLLPVQALPSVSINEWSLAMSRASPVRSRALMHSLNPMATPAASSMPERCHPVTEGRNRVLVVGAERDVGRLGTRHAAPKAGPGRPSQRGPLERLSAAGLALPARAPINRGDSHGRDICRGGLSGPDGRPDHLAGRVCLGQGWPGWWGLEGPEYLAWPNTELVTGDAVQAVAELKRTRTGTLSTLGSLSLCRSLLTAGLVDRFRLVVFPVITGSTGREQIYDGYPDISLDMVNSRTFDGRLQLLEYIPTVLSGPPGSGPT